MGAESGIVLCFDLSLRTLVLYVRVGPHGTPCDSVRNTSKQTIGQYITAGLSAERRYWELLECLHFESLGLDAS